MMFKTYVNHVQHRTRLRTRKNGPVNALRKLPPTQDMTFYATSNTGRDFALVHLCLIQYTCSFSPTNGPIVHS